MERCRKDYSFFFTEDLMGTNEMSKEKKIEERKKAENKITFGPLD